MIPPSRASQHAVRALTFLARVPPGEYRLTRELAVSLGIPAHYLAKVFQPLTARGILDSQRGRSGGVRLARPASEVALFELVDAIETLEVAVPCALGQRDCTDETPCPLHEYWVSARSRYLQTLMATSLSDVADFCERNPGSSYPFPIPDLHQPPA